MYNTPQYVLTPYHSSTSTMVGVHVVRSATCVVQTTCTQPLQNYAVMQLEFGVL